MFVFNAKLCSIYVSILEVIAGLNLVSLSGLFCLRNLGWFLKVQQQHYTATHPPKAYACSVRVNVQCEYLYVFIRDHVMHPNKHQLIQLMNIISNLIFHCNNCDANRAFVTICESTAAALSSSLQGAFKKFCSLYIETNHKLSNIVAFFNTVSYNINALLPLFCKAVYSLKKRILSPVHQTMLQQ